jgi:VIT1/CCC1 family predicted Fe2+/Mn2+ transporter
MLPSITFSVAPLVYGVVAAVLVCVLVLAAFIAIDARKQQQREMARHPMQSRR